MKRTYKSAIILIIFLFLVLAWLSDAIVIHISFNAKALTLMVDSIIINLIGRIIMFTGENLFLHK